MWIWNTSEEVLYYVFIVFGDIFATYITSLKLLTSRNSTSLLLPFLYSLLHCTIHPVVNYSLLHPQLFSRTPLKADEGCCQYTTE